MKFFISQLLAFLGRKAAVRNIKLLWRYLLVLLAMVTVYSITFHLLMQREGQNHSWVTGFYWTLTVMSTLGFGDITFESDAGRLFSILVLLSGMIFLLVLLPFTFIQFFYAPWIEAQTAARAPRQLVPQVSGHVILTHYDAVTRALINKLKQYGYGYALVVKDLPEALRLHDLGLNVVLGEPDLPETYERLNIHKAALIATTSTDVINTNIAFTVRELSKVVPIIASAKSAAAEEILKLAGSTHVIRLGQLMGQSLARRTIGGDAVAHVIGQFDQLLIAEATAAGTPLIGKTLAETRLRENAGINVIGVWERGRFETAGAQTQIGPNTVLVMAGSAAQFHQYNELFCIYHQAMAPVVIIGGGRVGRATGQALAERNLDFRMIERLPERIPPGAAEKYLIGDAGELEVLEKAGLKEAPAVIITPHDDDISIYLTIFCRRLRSDIQIISRATHERNVSTLHRAGADFVMSYASMGSNIIFNLLKRSDILMLAEGLNVFRMKTPATLAGKSLAKTNLRQETGCSVIAVNANSQLQINPDPQQPLDAHSEIILIGSFEAEQDFFDRYGEKQA
jgi:Trk K+ transport system NAD-binding subunit